MFVARTGGEEFALIVEGASEQATFELAERIRLLIEQTRFSSQGVNYGPITISMGICMASEAESAEDLYAKADRALYRSKVNGRNRVTKFAATQDRPLKSWLLYRKD
jgi:diguanylate cyclase